MLTCECVLLLAGVQDDMSIAREEIFGPVMCTFKFKRLEEVRFHGPHVDSVFVTSKYQDTMLNRLSQLQASMLPLCRTSK